MNHSLEGGTGSGTGVLFMEFLAETLPKVVRTNFIINYQPGHCTTPVGVYNSVLSLAKIQNLSDMTILMDNYSLY